MAKRGPLLVDMWHPQKSDFSTWVKNTFKHLADKRREKQTLWVYIDIHECPNHMPGEKIFSWCGEVERNG